MGLARAAAVGVLAAARRPNRADGVLFLFYHDMRAGERRRFEAQLGRLRDFGDLIGLTDATRLLAGGGGGRHVCLTFDDGCRGAFDHALPILAAHGAPAAFFVVAQWLDDAGSRGAGDGAGGHIGDRIGWEECRRLLAAGMEVGSHSLTHRRLGGLDRAEVVRELVASRTRIEAELGRPCVHFACPWGQPAADYHPEREPRLARDAGYRSFLTTIPRRAGRDTDPWCLPRVRMEPGWGAAELRYALSR